jgi:hypothetical protein
MSKTINQSCVDIGRLIPLKRSIDTEGVDDFYNNLIKQGSVLDMYTWEKDFPEFITGIINQVKGLFNLGENLKSFRVSLYPPALVTSKNVTKIPKSNLNILTRIVICAGHRESFEMEIAAGGHNATCNYLCGTNEGFQIASGSAPAVTFKYDDTIVGKMPPRKGFRTNTVKKDPTKRFIIIVDPIIDEKLFTGDLTTKNVE